MNATVNLFYPIIAIAALLAVPKPWRGLQPIDGWIMLAVYAVYLTIEKQYKHADCV